MEDALHEMKEMIGKDIRDKHKAMILGECQDILERPV